MRLEEGDQRRDGVEPEGVVAEVDGVQGGAGAQRGEQRGQRGRDLGQQPRGEDVGEVGALQGGQGAQERGQGVAGGDAERVAVEEEVRDGRRGRGEEGRDVRSEVGGGVELEGEVGEGECCWGGGGGGHFEMRGWMWGEMVLLGAVEQGVEMEARNGS